MYENLLEYWNVLFQLFTGVYFVNSLQRFSYFYWAPEQFTQSLHLILRIIWHSLQASFKNGVLQQPIKINQILSPSGPGIHRLVQLPCNDLNCRRVSHPLTSSFSDSALEKKTLQHIPYTQASFIFLCQDLKRGKGFHSSFVTYFFSVCSKNTGRRWGWYVKMKNTPSTRFKCNMEMFPFLACNTP